MTSRVALITGPDSDSTNNSVISMLAAELMDMGFSIRHVDVNGCWSVITGRNPVDVVVAIINDRSSAVHLVRSTSLARRHAVPLIVVELIPGALTALRKTRLGKLVSNRTVTRVLSADNSSVPPSLSTGELLSDVGLGSISEPRDGIAPLTLVDLDRVVKVHLAAFPESAMTLLGPKVVERYYRWQFIGAHPSPFAAGFHAEGHLIGFLVGGIRNDATSGFARRFLPTIVFSCIQRPKGARALFGPELANVLRFMIRRDQATQSPPPAATTRYDESNKRSTKPDFAVLSIAVDPDNQGTGAATALITAAEVAAADRGFERMRLSVDVNNHRATRFYEREGWERVIPESGQWEGKMIKVLTVHDC